MRSYVYDLNYGKITPVYGGDQKQTITLASHTYIEVGRLECGQKITKKGDFMAYIAKGTGNINTITVQNGDLIRGQNLAFIANCNDVLIVIISVKNF